MDKIKYHLMEAIGGYFGLELGRGEHFHKNALRLNTGRNCFEYILLTRKYRKVYIPYYTCEVMLQPLLRHGIDYEFYSIDINLEPVGARKLQNDEAFLYTNYFGLKQKCVEKLSEVYGPQLIIDNSQAFYSLRVDGIDTFYSPRKFFGVPDGGYVYTDGHIAVDLEHDVSINRISHLLERIEFGAEYGYKSFRQDDESLDNEPIKRMSRLTESILTSIDYKKVAERRRLNFQYLDSRLASKNCIKLEMDENAVPMVYPFMKRQDNLRAMLIKKRIFVATYWPNVLTWATSDTIEHDLTNYLFPLPLDQRYNTEDEARIIQTLGYER